MRRKKVWMAGLLICSVLAGGCGQTLVSVPELMEPVSPGVSTAKVTNQTIYEITYYESSVIPEIEELTFPESGVIEAFPAYVGMEVKKDDRLGTLAGASDEYDRQLEYCEWMKDNNAYQNALTTLAIEHARLENALYDAGNDMERLELQFEQQKKLQELDEAYAKDCLNEMKSHLSDAYLCATMDGVICAKADVREGSYVSEDIPVLSIANSDTQYLKCDYISPGAIERCDRVYAMIGDKEYELEYVPIDPTELSAIRMNEETAFSTFQVLDGEASLIGKYAVICLVKNKRENVTAIPITALFSDAEGDYVYRMDGENRTRVNVDTGVKGTHYVQIKEGLFEGETVYIQETGVPNFSNTITLDFQSFQVSSSVGVSVYYPMQTAITYESEYGQAVYAEWLVVNGDVVEKGQPLMNICTPVDEIGITELELKKERLEEEKTLLEEAADSAAKKKHEEIEGAEGTYKKLLQNEADRLELENSHNIALAEEKLADVREALEIAYEAQITTQITAPCDGTLLFLESYRKDDVIYPNSIIGWLYNTDEVLYYLADKSGIMRYGQSITLKDMRGTEFDSTLVSCNPLGASGNLLNQSVYLRSMDEIPVEKRYGLEANYDVIDLENVLVVPASAVNSDTFGTYVVEVVDNHTRRRYFTPGKIANGNCLVIDGLEAGIELVME